MSPLTERTPRSPQREEEQCAASRVRSLLMTVCVQHCEQVLRLYVVLRFFCTGSVLCHQPVLFLLILFCWSWLGWSVCVRECFSSVFDRIKLYVRFWKAVLSISLHTNCQNRIVKLSNHKCYKNCHQISACTWQDQDMKDVMSHLRRSPNSLTNEWRLFLCAATNKTCAS